MTRDQVKAILDRVLTWPPERQQDAAEILMGIEAQDRSGYQLSDEQPNCGDGAQKKIPRRFPWPSSINGTDSCKPLLNPPGGASVQCRTRSPSKLAATDSFDSVSPDE